MMKSTEAQIEAALAIWRSTNASRNKERLKICIDALMNAEDEEADEEDLAHERMESLASLLTDTAESLAADGVTTPAEFYERYDELAYKYRLDGTSGGDCTADQRADISRKEFRDLESVLKEKAPEGVVRDTITVPEEFRVLARHVLGIVGPDLPPDQDICAMNFWARAFGQSVGSRVHKVDDIPYHGGFYLTGTAGLEVALGWCSGVCMRGEFVCVYSRENEGDEWAWRFMWAGEDGPMYVCDTVPELFTWLLDQWSDSPLPNFEGVEDGNILMGMWAGI